MIALFPYLWLSLAREDFTASSEFLDLINKAMNTNIGNDNLDDVSNNASGDSEEDDPKYWVIRLGRTERWKENAKS